MADEIDVAVAAIPLVSRKALDAEDKPVPGVYSVMVRKGLSTASMASAALDVFHSECAVAVLDDFAFYVFDPRNGQVLTEEPDHEGYSKTHLGRDCARISDRVPGIYTITVEAVGDDGGVCPLGIVMVAAANKRDVVRKGLALLWDDRLDGASCLARYRTERLA